MRLSKVLMLFSFGFCLLLNNPVLFGQKNYYQQQKPEIQNDTLTKIRFDKNSNIYFSNTSKTLAEEKIRIYSDIDIQNKKDSLIKYIFGNEGLPGNTSIDTIQYDIDFEYGHYSRLERTNYNLSTIDKIEIKTKDNFIFHLYLFKPIINNNKLFVFYGAHGWGFEPTDRGLNNNDQDPGLVIPELLKQGYYVLGLSMPLQGNCIPMDSLENTGVIDWVHANSIAHDQLFQYAKNPFKYYFFHLYSALNYLIPTYNFSYIYMTGVSGGGWASTIYPAIDDRINFSFPVAGSTPLYLRTQYEGLGDAEQGYDYEGLYGIANYTELYVMASAGNYRGHFQILNKFDPCCFYGNNRYLLWIDSVKNKLEELQLGGVYNFILDDTHNEHKTSQTALNEILNFIIYYEGKSKEQIDISLKIKNAEKSIHLCYNTPTVIEVEKPEAGYNYLWQINKNDGNGFINIIDDSVYSGSNTSTLTINNIDSNMIFWHIRYVKYGNGIPTIYSLAYTIDIADPNFFTSNVIVSTDKNDVCKNETIKLWTNYKGLKPEFKWYIKSDFDTTYIPLDNFKIRLSNDTLEIDSINSYNSTFICKITDQCLYENFSDTHTIHFKSKPYIEKTEGIIWVCEGNDINIPLKVSGSNLSYQWESSVELGFSPLSDGSVFAGTNESELKIYSGANNVLNKLFRCKVNGDCGNTATEIRVNSIKKIHLLNQSEYNSICKGSSCTLFIETSGIIQHYEWEINVDGKYSKIDSNFFDINGVHSDKLTINSTQNLSNPLFRCNITGLCNTLVSNEATVIINEPTPAYILSNGTDSICKNFSPFYLKGTPNGGVFSGTGVNNNIFYPDSALMHQNTIKYTYTDNNGCETTAEKIIHVDDCRLLSNENNAIIAIPNPTEKNSVLYVNSVKEQQVLLHIMELNGKLCSSNKIALKTGINALNLDFSSYKNGVYIVKLYDERGYIYYYKIFKHSPD